MKLLVGYSQAKAVRRVETVKRYNMLALIFLVYFFPQLNLALDSLKIRESQTMVRRQNDMPQCSAYRSNWRNGWLWSSRPHSGGIFLCTYRRSWCPSYVPLPTIQPPQSLIDIVAEAVWIIEASYKDSLPCTCAPLLTRSGVPLTPNPKMFKWWV